MELAGRTVLLTGAAGGIGHHIADALVARGARLVATDTDAERLAQAPLPDGIVMLPCDLRDLDAVERLVADAGPVDVLVNCAGLEYTGAFHNHARSEIEDIVGVNLLGPLALIRAVLPGMLAQGSGHVVTIASISGKGPSPYLTTYAATKAGLLGLMQSLRVEYRDSGVGFSAVTPGFVEREGMYARMAVHGTRAPVSLGASPPEKVARAVVRAVTDDVPEIIVAERPMRPFFAVTQLSPRIGELGIIASGARRFLRKVGEHRGRA